MIWARRELLLVLRLLEEHGAPASGHNRNSGSLSHQALPRVRKSLRGGSNLFHGSTQHAARLKHHTRAHHRLLGGGVTLRPSKDTPRSVARSPEMPRRKHPREWGKRG